MLKQGDRYMKIRNSAPHVEIRRNTCFVLKYMLEACLERKMRRQIESVCERVA